MSVHGVACLQWRVARQLEQDQEAADEPAQPLWPALRHVSQQGKFVTPQSLQPRRSNRQARYLMYLW